MSRPITRSTKTQATNDENINIGKVTGKRPQIEESKPKLGQSRARNALFDITNNIPEQKKALSKPSKLQAVVQNDSGAPSAQQVPISDIKEEADEILETSLSDTEMDRVDEHTNESVHFGELTLGAPAGPQVQLPALPSICPVDLPDINNPQCVVEYIPDIMAHFRRSETKFAVAANYMVNQTDINPKMREILVDWLVEVHLKFKLRPETLFLTISNIDRFLERRAVSRTKLQLVGCTAMLIASKYEEIYAPEVRDFVYISDKAYTRDQILAMEAIMLHTLQFILTVPTCFRFGERYIKVARANELQANLVNYFMELTLQEYSFLKYLPSVIAASATLLALRVTRQPWTPLLESQTGYSEHDLRDCVNDLHSLASKDTSKYRAVRKKYLSRKYAEVSKLPLEPTI